MNDGEINAWQRIKPFGHGLFVRGVQISLAFFLVTLPVPVVNALNATAMAPCHSMSIIMIIIMIIMIMIILISIADYVKT